uniref:1-phosphatidylinositol 4-kinase n=1 Tax=Brassica oleracea var. oleracea TaxID=109376 RepID=A0A0D3C705_BRAOL
MEVQSELCKETKSQEVEDPDAERILEDDDWITNGANFNVDDDDLMDEDELLTEESHQGTKSGIEDPVHGTCTERPVRKNRQAQTLPLDSAPSSSRKKKSSPRKIKSIGVGVAAEVQKTFDAFSKTKIESIGVGVAAEAQKSFDAFSKTYPMEQDLVVEILPFPVMRAQDIIVAANMALKKKIFAQKISRPTNGVYFLMDEKMRKVAVFKPEVEEDGRWRKGKKANREVTAYLLDFPKDREGDGFGGVPPTTMVRCMDFKGDREKRWTKGSLQQFIPNQKWYVHGERSDAIFSIQDFQKMTLLDIRYGNTDRNQDNILNKEGKLIPIDHGGCFPTETLDVDKDLEILRTNGIELGGRAVFVFRVQHMVLKLGVLGGNVPKYIGHLLTNPLSGGTSESLGTLFHKCMTRNPTDVTPLTLRGNVYDAGKSRALVLVLPQRSRRSSMLSLRHAFSKTLPVHWVNKDILVSGEVRICSPYHDDCVTGGTATARDQIKAVLKQVRQELQLGTGGN